MPAKCVVQIPNADISMKIGSIDYSLNEVERIVELFQQFWKQIPSKDANVICSHWEKSHSDHHPQIWIEGNSCSPVEGSFADCNHDGNEVRLHWPSMGMLPDQCIKDLLSHEMAHVYQWATGLDRQYLKKEHLDKRLRDLLYYLIKDEWLVEVHADETATRWGFDVCSWTDWFLRSEEPGRLKKYYEREKLQRRWRRYYHSSQQATYTEFS